MTPSLRHQPPSRKRQSSSIALPSDPNGNWLCQVFGYPWAFIQANSLDPQTAQNQKLDWITVTKYPLKPRALWERWNDPDQQIGVRFGKTTSYGLLDIDIGSCYHSPESIAQIKLALETIGICRTVPLQSSWSGGLHLYLPLPEAVNTFSLACTLKYCLETQGFELKAGQLEILPNVKAWGNYHKGEFTHYQAHRLPLQPGSGARLLDDELNPQPYGESFPLFRARWEQAANGQDMELLNSALSKGRQHQSKRRRNRSSCRSILKEWQTDLESEISDGWTGPGQTNTLLKSIACYGVVFEQLNGDELSDYVEQTATSRPGYQQWCRHQHEIKARARAWARAAENYYWPPGHLPKRTLDLHQLDGQNNIINFNDERAQDAHHRIQATVAYLIEKNQLPDSITARAALIAKQAETSTQTLYKPNNLPLWHPAHQPTSTVSTETVTESVHEPETCERIDPTSSSAVSEPPNALTDESLEQPNIKELHTTERYMKCLKPLADSSLEKTYINPEQGGVTRGGDCSFPQASQLDLSDTIAQIHTCVRLLRWTRSERDAWIANWFDGKHLAQLLDDELQMLVYFLQQRWQNIGGAFS